LYTDQIPPISAVKCLNLLELANRLCLPRLLNLVECRVIEDLTLISQNETNETVDHCLKLLEPVKVHIERSVKNDIPKFNTFLFFSAAQRTSIGRVVHVIPVRQLQPYL